MACKNTNNVLFYHINSFKGIILEFAMQFTNILLISHAKFCKDWPSIYGGMAPDSLNKYNFTVCFYWLPAVNIKNNKTKNIWEILIKPGQISSMIYIYIICKFGTDLRRFRVTMRPGTFTVNIVVF